MLLCLWILRDVQIVLIIDDSMFERNRSKKVELLARAYDHADHRYCFGFRMFTLGWSDGSTFFPVNSVLLSSENKKSRVNEATDVDILAKVVYIRNRNKRKEWLCLISTDTTLDENWVNFFYTFLTKCLTSHGYRHFKCCFKCSEPCLETILNCLRKKSMIWLIHL